MVNGDVPDECFTGLDCTCYDDHPGGCGGMRDRTDHCYCPNYPICPYGALDGNTDADFLHTEVTCDDGQFIDSVQFDTTSFTSIKFRCR